MERVAWYSCYVDVFARLICEFIENGDDNIKPTDLPNLSVILSKMAFRLHKNILDIKRDIEFSEKN
jgi:hypothetical protein